MRPLGLRPSSIGPWQRAVVAAIGALALSAWLWSGNLKSCWGPADDHEIVTALGQDGSLSAEEYARAVGSSEVGSPGSYPRYRPAYYSVRFLEAALWGNSPRAWYATRLVLFAFCIATLVWLLAETWSVVAAAGVALFVASQRYWPDIWGRLGPSEAYAAVGVALASLGIFAVRRPGVRPGGSTLGWALAAIGAALAAGAKENFVLLAVVIAWLAVVEWRADRMTPGRWSFALLPLAVSAFVVIAVTVAVARRGSDVYARSIAPAGRWRSLTAAIAESPPLWLLPLAAAIGLVGTSLALRSRRRGGLVALAAGLRELFVVEGLLFAGWAAQIVFYDRPWESDSRYAFPGALLALAMLITPFALLPRRLQLPVAGRQVLAAAVGVVLASLAMARGFEPHRRFVRANQRSSCTFSDAIDRVAAAAHAQPRALVVLWSDNAGDFEWIWAAQCFLNARSVTNPLALATPEPYPRGPLSEALANELLAELAPLRSAYHAASEARNDGAAVTCLALGMRSDPPPSDCLSLGSAVPH